MPKRRPPSLNAQHVQDQILKRIGEFVESFGFHVSSLGDVRDPCIVYTNDHGHELYVDTGGSGPPVLLLRKPSLDAEPMTQSRGYGWDNIALSHDRQDLVDFSPASAGLTDEILDRRINILLQFLKELALPFLQKGDMAIIAKAAEEWDT